MNNKPQAMEGISLGALLILCAVSAGMWYGIFRLVRWLLP